MSNKLIRDLLLQRGEELFHAPAQLRHFTDNTDADALLNDLNSHPHAFVLACVMDRQVKAERAWLIPYLFSEKIGGFEFGRLQLLTLAEVRELMSKPVPLHRFPETMSENFYDAVQLIGEAYAGDAASIWRGRPSSAEVVYRFLQFSGVGPKIATMATNILAREFKIPLSDYYSVDISADVHVRRVFSRLGLVRPDASTDELIYVARSLCPEFPGLLDLPAWDIGRKWCRSQIPLYSSCYMQEWCPTSNGAIQSARDAGISVTLSLKTN